MSAVDWSLIAFGVLGSLLAGLCTGAGALLIFVRSRWTQRSQVEMLAFAAGVMLAASIFSLLLPALEIVSPRAPSAFAALAEVAMGLVLGVLTIRAFNHWIPHEHFIKGPEGRATFHLGRNWLFILAIALHNVPEGMSVGVSFGGGLESGIPVMTGIGIQNLPEGLAVAAALISDGFSRRRAFWIAMLTGLIEPLGGLAGALAVIASDALLPWGLSFAGGAMLYVIVAEIIPEIHRGRIERATTFSMVLGFLVMMVLDISLG
ncbi:MAG TPA: ZIP family metal transporter [Vulgatibacter sp.]|nr:ZIP family metal transporter [Vulgatibacter sp.]